MKTEATHRKQAEWKAEIQLLFTDSAHPLITSEKEKLQNNSKITAKQFRAMSRKHLLFMIRDLENELAEERKKNTELLLAYQAGLNQSVPVY